MILRLLYLTYSRLSGLEKMLIVKIYRRFCTLRMIIKFIKAVKVLAKLKDLINIILHVQSVLIKKLFYVMIWVKLNLLNMKIFKLAKFFSCIIRKFYAQMCYNSRDVIFYVLLVKNLLLFMILLRFF
jgi:hypothetical protein